VDGVTATLRRATEMDPTQRRVRMQRLRRTVRKETVFEWARDCLAMLDDL
jgi:trehalose-6-phosphate synthase